MSDDKVKSDGQEEQSLPVFTTVIQESSGVLDTTPGSVDSIGGGGGIGGGVPVDPGAQPAASTETPPATDTSARANTAPQTDGQPTEAAPPEPSSGESEQRETPPPPTKPISKFQSSDARNAEEQALEARLKVGDGTPQEALKWFNEHGFPGLKGDPQFDTQRSLWLFPDTLQLGTGEATFGGPPGDGSDSAGGTTSLGGSPGGGFGSSGGVGDGFPGDQSGTAATDTSGGPGARDGVAGGLETPPADAPPTPAVPRGSAFVDFDDDGTPIVAPESHFADDELEGALRDIGDSQVNLIARWALVNLLPGAYVARLMEGHILNPLLAAPAHIYAAAVHAKQGIEAGLQGDIEAAIAHDRAATEHINEAAMAVLAVVPLGEGVAATRPAGPRLAALGIEYKGPRLLPRLVPPPRWVLHQEWVTGTSMEQRFLLDGREVMVDGFANRNGQPFVDASPNMQLVEVKEGSRIRLVIEGSGGFPLTASEKMFQQLTNYIELAQRLEIAGVRYVITGGSEMTPLVNAFREIIRGLFPGLVESGFLEILLVGGPPPGWPGL